LDADVIHDTIQEMTIAGTEPKKDDKLYYLEKFNPKKYISWAQSFENYLYSVRGKSKVPLSYIICLNDVDPAQATTEYQRMLWQAPHTGYAFVDDNHEVYRCYKDMMIDTVRWTWFNQARKGDGRHVHTIITTHYRGTAETVRRAAEAESMLERLHYKSEASFSFERYVTK
jgi:hypothetical protein